MAEDGGRTRLGQAIAHRRRELALSQRAAAETAGIDRQTWKTAETGTRTLHVHNYAGIERALQWAAGSVEVVLAGGDPAPSTTSTPVPGEEKLAAEVERLQRLPLPAEDRLRLVRAVVALYEETATESNRGS